jgi:cytochrome c oxidase subunit 4
MRVIKVDVLVTRSAGFVMRNIWRKYDMNGLLNIVSLILGLCAWMIPILILLKKNASQISAIKGIFLSFVCALLSLFMQIMDAKYLIDRNDWTALMDTQGAVVFSASVMLIVVVVLNGVLLVRSSNPSVINETAAR